jgi:PAS domain S-box-containing protein
LLLRGQVVAIAPHGPWLFICTPWLSETEELDERGLTISDFAVQDPVVDVMYLLQLHRNANEELRQVNNLLNEKAASLSDQRQKARRLAFVAERTRNAVIITGRDGVIEWVNKAFEKMTGWPLSEAAGRKPGALLQGPQSDPKVISEMREKVACGQGFRSELVNYRKDGTSYWVDIEVEPITADDGSVSGFMALESDITVNKTREILRLMESAVAEVIALQADYQPAIRNLLEGLSGAINSFMACWWVYDPNNQCLCLVETLKNS